MWNLYSLLILGAGQTYAAPQTNDWSGDWISNHGAFQLDVDGNRVNANFIGGGSFSATVDGSTITAECTRGDESWKGTITLGQDGRSFIGKRQFANGYGDSWRGWKRNQAAADATDANFSGTWLCNWGTMQLKQEGNKVSGFYTAARWGSLNGEVKGRVLKFNWQKFNFRGTAEIEMAEDGKRFYGIEDGNNNPTVCFGLKPEGFENHVAGKAGDVVQGVAENGMLYHLRMPDKWIEGQPVDVVILLHGSNWTTAGMVSVTAQNWPEVGQKFAILGIQGESWANWSDLDDLRFNYT